MQRPVLLAVIVLSACSSKTTGSNKDCDPGEVFVDKVCVRLCDSDAICESGFICREDICISGSRTDLPGIAEIDGDGSPVTSAESSRFRTDNPTLGSLQPSHLAGGIVVRGFHLEGAAFTLSTAAAPVELAKLTNSDTEVTLALPSTIAEGQYTLVATNAAGSDQAEVYLLRGEQGPPGQDGSPDTAADVLAKLLTVDGSGSGIDADTIDGLDSADMLVDGVGVIDSGHIADGTVDTVDLADGGVTTAKLADGAVTPAKIAGGSAGYVAWGGASCAGGFTLLYSGYITTLSNVDDGNRPFVGPICYDGQVTVDANGGAAMAAVQGAYNEDDGTSIGRRQCAVCAQGIPACYTHWGATSCATGYSAAQTGWITNFGDAGETPRPLTPNPICASFQITTNPNAGWGAVLHQGSYNQNLTNNPQQTCAICCPD